MTEFVPRALFEHAMDRLTAIEKRATAQDIEIAELRCDLGAVRHRVHKREYDALDDEWPDWRDIVGVVDIRNERSDPNNPFRQWLATKSPAYRRRIEAANSAELICEAIYLFQSEQKQQSPQ